MISPKTRPIPDTWLRVLISLDILGAVSEYLPAGEAKWVAGHRPDWRPLYRAGLIEYRPGRIDYRAKRDGSYRRVMIWRGRTRLVRVRLTEEGLMLARSASPALREEVLTGILAQNHQ